MCYALHISVLSHFSTLKKPQAENGDERNKIIAVSIV